MKHLNGEYKVSKSKLARVILAGYEENRISFQTFQHMMQKRPEVGNRIAKMMYRNSK